MLRPQGYAVISEPGKADEVRESITCTHCNCIVFLKPRQPPPGFCRLCYNHLCEACTTKGVCTPFEKRLEEMEARERFHRAVGT